MTEIEVKPEHVGDPTTRRVGILVGVVGILLSIVTIASHRAHTNAVIHRTESNDQWSYYQAKKIRESSNDVALTILQALGDTAKSQAPFDRLTAARAKYADDAKEIQKEAEAKDKESQLEEKRALLFDIGEGLLELGLVLCSLYFMARKDFFPVLGIVASAAGTVLGIAGFLVGYRGFLSGREHRGCENRGSAGVSPRSAPPTAAGPRAAWRRWRCSGSRWHRPPLPRTRPRRPGSSCARRISWSSESCTARPSMFT